jgi:(2R)-3-sulfolactate dehydrogenase (NADP+)
MSDVVALSVDQCRSLGVAILQHHNTSQENAECVTDALIAAEIDGQSGHGLSRLPSYAAQAAAGKVNGHAVPVVRHVGAAAVRVDAGNGFAFPALAKAVSELDTLVAETGIAVAAVYRSHHFGQAGYHVEQLAARGRVGLIFGNSPKAIAPWGGQSGVFGTNPIAFAVPRADQAPLVIDLSLSRIARGKIMVAAQRGEPIDPGWALDPMGRPTTDAQAAMAGTMLPMGDAKGAALVMMVEILAAALTGAKFGFEASSFFDADGPPPGVGQLMIAMHGEALSGGTLAKRLETLITAVLEQTGTRLPGSRRRAARAATEFIEIPRTSYDELRSLL